MLTQILAAYGAYIIGDELLSVSGLLALVALGTWISAKGQHRISSRVDGPLRAIWCAALVRGSRVRAAASAAHRGLRVCCCF